VEIQLKVTEFIESSLPIIGRATLIEELEKDVRKDASNSDINNLSFCVISISFIFFYVIITLINFKREGLKNA